MSAGKGSRLRTYFSEEGRNTYDAIFRKDKNFESFLAKLSDKLYSNHWYSQSIHIKKCKNIEECRKYIINHCGEEYLQLIYESLTETKRAES